MQHRYNKPFIHDVINFHGLWTNKRLSLINPVSEANSISAADEQGIIPNNVPADEC